MCTKSGSLQGRPVDKCQRDKLERLLLNKNNRPHTSALPSQLSPSLTTQSFPHILTRRSHLLHHDLLNIKS